MSSSAASVSRATPARPALVVGGGSPQPPPAPDHVLRHLHRLDLSDNPRIPVLMELVGALSRADAPEQVARTFSNAIQRIYGRRGYVSLSTRGLGPGQYRITRITIDGEIVRGTFDPWNNSHALPVQSGGLLGALIRSAYPEIIHHLDLRHDPVLGQSLAKYHSLMAVPLFDNGEPLNWAIVLREEPEGFTAADLEEQILRANLVGGTVKNTLMTRELRLANERIRGEMERIARIQRALLPQTLPEFPGLQVASSYETFDTAGGDLYDFTVLPPPDGAGSSHPGRLAMLIADASGHGPAAAVVTAMLNAIIYAYPGRDEGPGKVLEFANRHLHAKQLDGTFVTAFLAVYDPQSHRLSWARAGHNPPLLKTPGSGNVVERLDAVGGIPLGVTDDAQFDDATVQLQPGQTVVLYTDGIPEAMDPDRRMFGVDGIEQALIQCSGEPACVVDSITTALKTHEAGVRPSDDQTILAVKFE